jgi:hypothetical protein
VRVECMCPHLSYMLQHILTGVCVCRMYLPSPPPIPSSVCVCVCVCMCVCVCVCVCVYQVTCGVGANGVKESNTLVYEAVSLRPHTLVASNLSPHTLVARMVSERVIY